MLPSLAKFEWDFFGDFQTMCRKGTVLFSKKEGAGAARWCFVCFAVRCRWVPDRHGISRTWFKNFKIGKIWGENFESWAKIWRNVKFRVHLSCSIENQLFFWNKLFPSLKSFLSYWWWNGNIFLTINQFDLEQQVWLQAITTRVQNLGHFWEFPLDWLISTFW